jgi:hypothetical protein
MDKLENLLKNGAVSELFVLKPWAFKRAVSQRVNARLLAVTNRSHFKQVFQLGRATNLFCYHEF